MGCKLLPNPGGILRFVYFLNCASKAAWDHLSVIGVRAQGKAIRTYGGSSDTSAWPTKLPSLRRTWPARRYQILFTYTLVLIRYRYTQIRIFWCLYEPINQYTFGPQCRRK